KNAGETIGKTVADSSGNFVILPDQFLPQGDHQLQITSVAPGEDASAEQSDETVGEQTAVIAIPEKGKESELLAVLTTNEGPSLIVEKPEPAAEPLAEGSSVAADASEPLTKPNPVEETTETQVAALEPNTETPAAPVEEAATTAKAEVETAEPKIEAEPKATRVVASAARIEAIETEDRRMFVAGSAAQGSKLRLYLDNRFLGATTGGEGDRFLFERSITIEPGDYQLRIDQIGADGTVVSRAQVPFTREDDRQLQASLVAPTVPAVEGAGVTPGEQATSDATEPSKAVNTETAKGPDALDGVGEIQSADDTSPTVEPAAVPTTNFAVTETKDRSVIIRRGDSLWRISRRVYGEGIRYTTIFLANKDQIRDPDKIYPGQIFGLPEDEEVADPVANDG
ncbi:MAG: LysM peptidoglycan-binding domain-containing protein, partial [Pseudomonadota bacterium]